MTPKEKAKQLYDKMEFETKYNSQPSTVHGMCKKLALVCVDEIIEELREEIFIGFLDESNLPKRTMYWQEVKQEINQIKEDDTRNI